MAVRRGGARPGGRLRGPGRAGDRRQRELLQPDRRRRRSTRRRSSGCSACTTTSGGGCRSGSAGRRQRAAARPHRRGIRRLAVGARRARAPRRAAAAVDLDAERRLATVLAAAAGRAGCWPPRTTCPTAASRSRSPSAAWRAVPAPRSACRADPFTSLFSESAARAVVAVRPGARPLSRIVRGARGARHRARPDRRDALAVTGCFSISLDELGAAHRQTLPASSADRPAGYRRSDADSTPGSAAAARCPQRAAGRTRQPGLGRAR